MSVTIDRWTYGQWTRRQLSSTDGPESIKRAETSQVYEAERFNGTNNQRIYVCGVLPYAPLFNNNDPLSVFIYFVNPSAGNGDVRFEAYIRGLANGETYDVTYQYSVGAQKTINGRSAERLNILELAFSSPALQEGDHYILRVNRAGGNVLDTETNDVDLLAVELRSS